LQESESEAYSEDDNELLNDSTYMQNDEKELDITMKAGNIEFFEESGRFENSYDDTVKPGQFHSARKNSASSATEQMSSLAANMATLKADSSFLNVSRIVPHITDPTDTTTVKQPVKSSSWDGFFNSLTPDTLRQLLILVEKNESKEIQSIRNEFEPKLNPIMEGILFKSKKN
jgi:hypothetical protein